MTSASRSVTAALLGARSLAACSLELHHQLGRLFEAYDGVRAI